MFNIEVEVPNEDLRFWTKTVLNWKSLYTDVDTQPKFRVSIQKEPIIIQEYANPEEIERMKLANPEAIKQMSNFFARIPKLGEDRAIEIAGGEFHVSKDLLRHRFRQIDLMD